MSKRRRKEQDSLCEICYENTGQVDRYPRKPQNVTNPFESLPDMIWLCVRCAKEDREITETVKKNGG